MNKARPRARQPRRGCKSTHSGPPPSASAREEHLPLLNSGEIHSPALMPEGSNYTFLVTVEKDGQSCQAVYKPLAGEQPLWDFPSGTLYKRERATYIVSLALGWPLVPPTVVRDGPHGVGSVQLYVDADPNANYFSLAKDHTDVFLRIALFDLFVNNADRKAGHCLLGRDGLIWVIDHGLTFNTVFKLRTVIWDFCGQPFPEPLLNDVRAFLAALSDSESAPSAELSRWLAPEEIEALKHRGRILLDNPIFPQLDPRGNVPWPWF